MLRNIYVQRDKKIFQDIKHFADIITDQIGFRLVTFTHFAGIITDQIGFRLVTGWLKCTDCTDCLFFNPKIVRIVRICFQIVRIVRIFYPGKYTVFFYFHSFQQIFHENKKKFSSK